MRLGGEGEMTGLKIETGMIRKERTDGEDSRIISREQRGRPSCGLETEKGATIRQSGMMEVTRSLEEISNCCINSARK